MWKDSETEIDFLDYDYLVNSIMGIVCDDKILPACIGLYGNWGSGKSSLIHMCKSRLESQDKNVKCLIFNGWLFESYEDAKTSILGEILDSIKEESKLTEEGKRVLLGLYKSIDKLKLAKNIIKTSGDLVLTGGMGTLLDLSVSNAFSALTEKIPEIGDNQLERLKDSVEKELDFKDIRENVREFQKQFDKLLEQSKISRLVVFIDELDRCRPDTIIDTLEAIKLFLFTGKTAFIIGVDQRHIEYAIRTRFPNRPGQDFDIGKEYLEKMIQYSIKIPLLDVNDVKKYVACLLLQESLDEEQFRTFIGKIQDEEKSDFRNVDLAHIAKELNINAADELSIAHQLSELMTQTLKQNPRQCKRFLNMLDLRLKQATYRRKKLKRRVLAKMMMLEYYRPSAFRRFAELATKQELSVELLKVENENKLADSELLHKEFANDSWFERWFATSPKLSEEDLNLYLYFSRTSLEERISLLTASMSPLAQSLVESLLSKKEEKVDDAIENIKTISTYEASSVLEAVGNHLLEMEKPDKDQVIMMLKIAEQRTDLYDAGMKLLSQFTVNQLEAGESVYIARFAKKAGKTTEITNLLETTWKGSNLLVRTIKNSMNYDA